MFVAGDEVRNTQYGNNNSYCQDNEIGWFNWSGPAKHSELLRFWRRMIAFRKRHSAVRQNFFFTGEVNERGLKDVTWHGTKLYSPGWSDSQARALGFTLAGFNQDPDIHVMMNMHWQALEMEIPVVAGRQWTRVVDTSLPSPSDIAEPGKEFECRGQSYLVSARSIVVLVNGQPR
jgi:glycogen operon protein